MIELVGGNNRMRKSSKKTLIVVLVNSIVFTIGCVKKVDVSVEDIESSIINNLNIVSCLYH